jgi:ubiquinone/menaquinone biosynthesis C-methylase UbiE
MPPQGFPKRCPAWLAFTLGWRARLWLLSPRRLFGSLPLRPGLRVLDLGSGPGVLARLVADAVPGGEVVLVDAQHAMLVKAQRRFAAGAPARVAFVQAVAERLPLARETFDIVLLVTVLGELDDRAAALAEVHRVLKPGGMLSISEHLPDPDFRAASTARRLALQAGFEERELVGGRWSYTSNVVKKA